MGNYNHFKQNSFSFSKRDLALLSNRGKDINGDLDLPIGTIQMYPIASAARKYMK